MNGFENALLKLGKIVPQRAALETLIIQNESLHDIFPKPLRCPNPELCTLLGFHPVAHGNDDVEVIILHLLALRFISNTLIL